MKIIYLVPICLLFYTAHGQQAYNGTDSHLSNLFLLSNAQSRSISPENFNGAKGGGRQGRDRHRVRSSAGPRAGLEDQSFGGYKGALDIYDCGNR